MMRVDVSLCSFTSLPGVEPPAQGPQWEGEALCVIVQCSSVLMVFSPVQSDPYVKLRIGKNRINDKDNFIPNNLDPIFGR